jgi:hypothetical protein
LGTPIVDLFGIDPYFHVGFNGKVLEIIIDGGWNLPPTLRVNEVTDRLPLIPCVPLPDTLVWSHSTDDTLSTKNVVAFLKPPAPHMPWANIIWKGCIPPSHSFTFCRWMHRKMPTDENLRTRGCIWSRPVAFAWLWMKLPIIYFFSALLQWIFGLGLVESLTA